RSLQLRLDGLASGARAKPSERANEIVSALCAPRVTAEIERDPDLGVEVWQDPLRRQHADDLVGVAVERQRLSDCARIRGRSTTASSRPPIEAAAPMDIARSATAVALNAGAARSRRTACRSMKLLYHG